jgi:hypothetical protein
MNFLLFCGIPIAVGLVVAAPNIIGFLYHRAEFAQAVPVVQLLAPGLVFLYINSVLSSTIISTKREKNITIMAGIALVFNVGLNLILIPRYLHIGAAAVTSLTELLLMCLAFVFVPRSLLPLGSLKVGIKALAASAVMALVIWATRQMDLFVILSFAMGTYFVASALFGTIPREDVKALYVSIRNKAGHTEQEQTAQENVDESVVLTPEEIQPELESAFAFRLELTDPLLPTHGNEVHFSDAGYRKENDEKHQESHLLRVLHADPKEINDEFEETQILQPLRKYPRFLEPHNTSPEGV